MKLNAPPGYHWTDHDVEFEKTDSWYAGVTLGIIIGAALVLFAVVIA